MKNLLKKLLYRLLEWKWIMYLQDQIYLTPGQRSHREAELHRLLQRIESL